MTDLPLWPPGAGIAIADVARYSQGGPFTAAQSITPTAGTALTLQAPAATGDVLTIKSDTGASLFRFRSANPGGQDAAINFHGANALGPGGAAWDMGIDSAAAIPYRDFFLAKIGVASGDSDPDGIYISNGGAAAPASVGIGLAQPSDTADGLKYRLKVMASGTAGNYPLAGQGGLQVLFSPGQTGNTFRAGGVNAGGGITLDSADRVTIQNSDDPGAAADPTAFKVITNGGSTLLSAGLVNGSGMILSLAGKTALGPGATNAMVNDTMTLAASGANNASLKVRTSAQGAVAITANGAAAAATILTTNASSLALGTNSTARINISSGGNIGFFGAAAVAQQSAGVVAIDPASTQTLANALRTALVNLGLAA